MKLKLDTAQLFIPDGVPVKEALARTTQMAIGAHQDDLEITTYFPILECFGQKDKWFTGVIVTDGRGSPRDGLYKDCTDEDMRMIRIKEQKKAAVVGEYAAVALLDYPSSIVKDSSNKDPVEDIAEIIKAASPEVIYTHNPADKHDTHVAVVLRIVEAIRSLPDSARPKRLLGCEAWRDLDWMADEDRVVLDVSEHENLQGALMGIFDSQIAGGKRYDLATMGRRRAHATFLASHGVDISTSLIYAIDLTSLIENPTKDVVSFVQEYIDRFAAEVKARIEKMK